MDSEKLDEKIETVYLVRGAFYQPIVTVPPTRLTALREPEPCEA